MVRRLRLMLAALAVVTLLGVVPAASAVAAPPYGVKILSSSTYVDVLDNVHVVGEVSNNTRFPVEFIQITVNFFDTADVIIGTESTYVGVDTLDPGQKAPFDVFTDLDGIDRYALRAAWSSALAPANHNFTVNVTNVSADASGLTHIVGTAKNNNTTVADYVRIDATLYDATGGVVDAPFTFVNTGDTSTLDPGVTGAFDLIVFNDVPYTSYVLVASSNTPPALPVTIAASPTTPLYGTLVRVSGHAAPGAAVTIQRWDLSAGWVNIAQATADVAGSYSTTAKILKTWFIRASTNAGFSVPRVTLQKTLVTLTANATAIKKGTAVTFSGLVRPVYPGKRVAIQQLVSGVWKNIGYATLTSTSTFSFRWLPKTVGTLTYRASIVAQADSLANVSASRRIVVRL